MCKKDVIVVPDERDDQERLDAFLAEQLPGMSRSRIRKIIQEGCVTVDGALQKPSYRLHGGERITVEIKGEKERGLQAEDIPLNIMYSDPHIAILDKPYGLVVHPGTGVREHTLVHALLFAFPGIREIGPADRPGIVHRLDKDTSGVMVVALKKEAFIELQRQFKSRLVEKAYYALVWGTWSGEEGTLTWSLGRHPKDRKRISVKTQNPRHAETRFKVIRRFENYSLLDVKPVTGRTHQIRVHMAAAGHPVVGDRIYGKRKSPCPRLFLHATYLEFSHPATGERVQFTSPFPSDLQGFLETLD